MSDPAEYRLDDDRREELASLWTKSQYQVESYLRTVLVRSQDREDLLQETARKASRYFNSYNPERSFSNWAIGIARNAVIDFKKKSSGPAQTLSLEALGEISDAYARVGEETSSRADALELCIEHAKPRQRKLLELHYGSEMSVDEIAKKLGAQNNTIYVSLRRIRLALMDCINRRVSAQEAGR